MGLTHTDCLTMEIINLVTYWRNGLLEWCDFLELLAVLMGEKKFVQISGSVKRLEMLSSLAHTFDLYWAIPPIHLETIFDTSMGDSFFRYAPGKPENDAEGIIFIGDKSTIIYMIDMKNKGFSDKEAANLYGYPSCCANIYKNNIKNGNKTWVDSFLENIHGVKILPWQTNRLARIFTPYFSCIPDYFPCSPFCEASIRLAKIYFSLLQRLKLYNLAALVKKHLSQPLLRYKGCIYLLNKIATDKLTNCKLTVKVDGVNPYIGTPITNKELNLHCTSEGIFIQEINQFDPQGILMLFK